MPAMLAGFNTQPCWFNANQTNTWLIDKISKHTNRIRTATYACQYRIRQAAFSG